jgi:hypothetical protein
MPIQVGNQDHEELANQSHTKVLSLSDLSKRFEVAQAGYASSCAQPPDLLSGINSNDRIEETILTKTPSTFVRRTGIGRRWEDFGQANLRASVEPPVAQLANLDCANEKDQPESAEPTSHASVKGVFFSACKYIQIEYKSLVAKYVNCMYLFMCTCYQAYPF